jgi:hypothetical protein
MGVSHVVRALRVRPGAAVMTQPNILLVLAAIAAIVFVAGVT